MLWSLGLSSSDGASRGLSVGWIEIGWDAPDGAGGGRSTLVDRYELQMRPSGEEAWRGAASGAGEGAVLRGTTFVISDLKPLRKYYFRVRALTVLGWSAYTPSSDAVSCSRRY